MHKLDTVGPVVDRSFLLWAPVDIHDLMIFIFIKLVIIFYNNKALMHTQPSIVLLPGIHTTMYIL